MFFDEYLYPEDLEDNEETALLLEDAVIKEDAVRLNNLLLKMANINTKHLKNSLLAISIINKKTLMIEEILATEHYEITESDIKEIYEIIEKITKNKPENIRDQNLSMLIMINSKIRPIHYRNLENQFKTIMIVINSVIYESLTSLLKSNKHKLINIKELTYSSPVERKSELDAVTMLDSCQNSFMLHEFNSSIKKTYILHSLFSMLKGIDLDAFNSLLKKLIEDDCEFNINGFDEKGKTLLHYAVITPDDRFLKLLLENGANPNIRDNLGWTPLHYSIYTGSNFKVFRNAENIEYPLNWLEKTMTGKTVIDLALKGKINKSSLSEEDVQFISLKVTTPIPKNISYK